MNFRFEQPITFHADGTQDAITKATLWIHERCGDTGWEPFDLEAVGTSANMKLSGRNGGNIVLFYR